MLCAESSQLPNKVQETLLSLIQLPVVPGYFIVLAIGIVVAALRAPDFISPADHWYSL
jgi:hypothetical protein